MADHEALLARLTASVATWMAPLCVCAALLLGLATSAIGEARRINLHTAPILILIAWNLAVYLLIVASFIFGWNGRDTVHRLFAWFAGMRLRRLAGRSLTDATLRSAIDRWLAVSRELLIARSGLALHLAAAAFMAGAIAGMYLRGVGFEYLAGWESTFLDATGVRRLLVAALWPGTILTGVEVGDIASFEALRFHDGTGGSPATRWIHLFAAAGLLWVIVPRLLLAGWAGWRVRNLMRGATTRRDLLVTAHGLPLNTATRERVRNAVIGTIGLTARVGFTDEIAAADARAKAEPVVLFALAATPEDEVHGALIRDAKPVLVLLDEQSFASRFARDEAVMARRRGAWETFLRRYDRTPIFVGAGS